MPAPEKDPIQQVLNQLQIMLPNKKIVGIFTEPDHAKAVIDLKEQFENYVIEKKSSENWKFLTYVQKNLPGLNSDNFEKIKAIASYINDEFINPPNDPDKPFEGKPWINISDKELDRMKGAFTDLSESTIASYKTDLLSAVTTIVKLVNNDSMRKFSTGEDDKDKERSKVVIQNFAAYVNDQEIRRSAANAHEKLSNMLAKEIQSVKNSIDLLKELPKHAQHPEVKKELGDSVVNELFKSSGLNLFSSKHSNLLNTLKEIEKDYVQLQKNSSGMANEKFLKTFNEVYKKYQEVDKKNPDLLAKLPKAIEATETLTMNPMHDPSPRSHSRK